MKFKCFKLIILLSISLLYTKTSYALAVSNNTNSYVSVTSSGYSEIFDPENPEEIINPGDSNITKGLLRIDYVFPLNFGGQTIDNNDRIFTAVVPEFENESGARANFIQITDQQSNSSGWTLFVKQEMQFKNTDIQNENERELSGAILSFDKVWVSSSSGNKGPSFTREPIYIESIGQSYEVAKANKNEGKGIWSISFGASKDNTYYQDTTLFPMFDTNSKKIIDKRTNKQKYYNSAIKLSIPDETKINPVEYKTKITWILSKLP